MKKEMNYSFKLKPKLNERKYSYLNDTYEFLKSGSDKFFDFWLAMHGGINKTIIESEKEELDELNKLQNAQLKCAVNWFRVVKKNDLPNLNAAQMESLFEKYFGDSANNYVKSYFNLNYDEDVYQWVDCRVVFQKLATEIGVSFADLTADLASLAQRKLIFVDNVEGWEICSSIFGDGEKEDFAIKAGINANIVKIIKEKSPKNFQELKKCIFDGASKLHAGDSVVSNISELKRKYGCVGSPSVLIRSVASIENGSLNEDGTPKNFDKELKNVIKNCEKAFKDKSGKTDLICNKQIKSYLQRVIGSGFDQNVWSQMCNNALADILPKSTRNIGLAIEQCENNDKLKKPSKQAESVLFDFFESPYFTGNDKFTIKPSHLGKLNNLFKNWETDSCEDGIKNYIEDVELDRIPHEQLLKFIYTKKDIVTADELICAAEYFSRKERLERIKINPTVIGNLSFTYGDSALKGCIDNFDAQQNYSENKSGIWVTLNLLNKGKWQSHHILTYNSRFYNDYLNPKLSSRQRGEKQNFVYNQENAALINSAKLVGRSKMLKRILRGSRSNVNRSSGLISKHSLSFNKINGRFVIDVNVKFELPKLKKTTKEKFNLGDVIVAFDQNQTVSHTYTVLKVVLEGVPYDGYNWKVLEVGKITSNTKSVHDKQIDQLSYDGMENGIYFEQWITDAQKYVNSLGDLEVEVYDKNIKAQKFVKISDCFANVDRNNLMRFNSSYASFLSLLLRGNFDLDQIKIRNEIIRLCESKLSSLNRGTLSYQSLKSLGNLKRLLSSYIDRIVIKDATKEDKIKADGEIMKYVELCDRRRVNKRKEKINRCADFILNKAIEHNAFAIVGEANLPTANSKNNKTLNKNIMDWCARGLSNKLYTSSKMLGIRFIDILPHSTSHQQPFVHTKDNECMSARFADYSDISDFALEKCLCNVARYLKIKKTEGKTAKYYRLASEWFATQYEIDKEKIGVIPVKEFRQHMKNMGQKRLIVPMRGGRCYLALHKLKNDAEAINYAGQNFYLHDSDEVAAINIAIVGIKKLILASR